MSGQFSILYFGGKGKQALLEDLKWRGEGCELLITRDEKKALTIADRANPQVILIDYDQEGFKPLPYVARLMEKSPNRLIIGLTDKSSLDCVVKSIKMGVKDVIHTIREPVKLNKELTSIIERATEVNRGDLYFQREREKYDFHNIIGQSREMQRIFQMIDKIIRRKWLTVLILGETGTGKELLARAIHYKSFSHFHPFVEINCNTLPENLLESELFGHEKGAFTDAIVQKKGLFELAHDGTLFLDEIGDIAQNIQLKLLRAIEGKTIRRVGGTRDIHVNTRIIAATNRDLQEAIGEGAFRRDLYYRLNVVSICLPPLKDRGDDVMLLAERFLADLIDEYSSPMAGFSDEAISLIREYHWPGNVRELKHTIERIVLLSEGDRVERADLEEAIESEIPLVISGEKHCPHSSLVIPEDGMSLAQGERIIIETILNKTGWNKRKASEILEISRPRLDRKIEQYGLVPNWNHQHRKH